MIIDGALWAIVAVGVLSTVVGAIAQRSTGIGFALIAAPGLVIVLGASDGVMMVNICGGLAAGVAALHSLRLIDWKMFFGITVPALFVLPLGAATVFFVDAEILQFSLGTLVVAALLLPLVLRKVHSGRPRPWLVPIVGAVLGFVNSAVGVGGPALIAYAAISRWDFERFRATAQSIFFCVGLGSFAARIVVGAQKVENISWPLVALLVASTLFGVATGSLVVRSVPLPIIRKVSVSVALLGAMVVVADAAAQIASR